MVISSAESIVSINPATKEKVGEVPLMHAGQVEEAVEQAWRAFDIWQMTNFYERSKMLMKFHKVLKVQLLELLIIHRIQEEVEEYLIWVQ